MLFDFRPRQHRTTTTIDKDDWKFLKDKGIKVAHAVRAFCQERRAQESGQLEESIINLRGDRDKVIQHRDKIMVAVRKILNEKQFTEFLQKI